MVNAIDGGQKTDKTDMTHFSLSVMLVIFFSTFIDNLVNYVTNGEKLDENT